MENYKDMKVTELKNVAKERGIRGYYSLRKSELIEKIKNRPPLEYSRAQLIQMAKERGLKNFYQLRKHELLKSLRASEKTILDREIDARMVNVPFLRATPYTAPQATRIPSTPTPTPSSNDVQDLINYLNNVKQIPKSLSPKLQELKDGINRIFEKRKIFEIKESDSALKKFAKVYTIDGKLGYGPQSFLDGARENITKVIRDNCKTKVKLSFKCYMEWVKTGEIKPADFHSNIEVNLDGTDEKELYDTMVERVLENIAKLIKEGSEIIFHSVINLELHTVIYKPLRGETYIPLPKELADKKAIINIKNKDNKCFLWSVLRALNPSKNNPQRLDQKLMGRENTLNMEGICYPVSLKDTFEKQKTSLSITVLGYDGKSVYLLRNSKNTDREHIIVLILIEEAEVKHYCLVKDFSRLLSSQVSNHKGKHHFCSNCFNPFWCQKSLNRHLEYCNKHEAVKIKMPEEGTILKFINYHRGEKVPFIVYADFECFIKPVQSCNPDDKSSYTKQYQKHEPSSFCCYIKCFDDEVYKPKIVNYTGKDAAQKFVEMLEEDIREIANIPQKKIIFNIEEQKQYEKETVCWICNGKFDDVKN